MGYGSKGQMAATGLGVSIFGYYVGEWWIVALVVALMVAGALLVRASKSFRRDGGI